MKIQKIATSVFACVGTVALVGCGSNSAGTAPSTTVSAVATASAGSSDGVVVVSTPKSTYTGSIPPTDNDGTDDSSSSATTYPVTTADQGDEGVSTTPTTTTQPTSYSSVPQGVPSDDYSAGTGQIFGFITKQQLENEGSQTVQRAYQSPMSYVKCPGGMNEQVGAKITCRMYRGSGENFPFYITVDSIDAQNQAHLSMKVGVNY